MNFIDVLQEAVSKSSQRAVSAKIGYSTTVISQVLNGRYPGDITAVEQAVKRKLTTNVINCPVLGEITPNSCSEHSSREFSSASSIRVKLFKACSKCPFNTRRKEQS
ncbi:MAG: hypothetical protein CBB87_08180 [Micavibrio sp. TMED27]|nr:transcriptional regulator [Micavibrio sp.]OUT90648.1 MAG: hypothetical protein CBB87_08180 [Micavibrio sp. TMED27]|tara:strand:+ start:4043 stop:4363 length:321 start_codon:yes stop_codon:yes gene_type:complete